jgi:hypothetical protein
MWNLVPWEALPYWQWLYNLIVGMCGLMLLIPLAHRWPTCPMAIRVMAGLQLWFYFGSVAGLATLLGLCATLFQEAHIPGIVSLVGVLGTVVFVVRTTWAVVPARR